MNGARSREPTPRPVGWRGMSQPPRKPAHTVAMDAGQDRMEFPAAPGRLHGADRSALGQTGWAEVAEDLIGAPDDSDIGPEYFKPQPEAGAKHG